MNRPVAFKLVFTSRCRNVLGGVRHSGRSDGGRRAPTSKRGGPLALARRAGRPYRHQGAVPGRVHRSQPRILRQVSHCLRLHVKPILLCMLLAALTQLSPHPSTIGPHSNRRCYEMVHSKSFTYLTLPY